MLEKDKKLFFPCIKYVEASFWFRLFFLSGIKIRIAFPQIQGIPNKTTKKEFVEQGLRNAGITMYICVIVWKDNVSVYCLKDTYKWIDGNEIPTLQWSVNNLEMKFYGERSKKKRTKMYLFLTHFKKSLIKKLVIKFPTTKMILNCSEN